MIYIIESGEEKEKIAREILSKLPEWFGMADSTEEYIKNSTQLFFLADIENGKARGFIALKETSKYTIEIYVIGVLKEFHRNSIGRNLFEYCYNYSKKKGFLYMQVKTIKEGCYREYDKTIAFYKSLGFKEFECMPKLWDEWNPCQIYIMDIN